MLQCCQIKRENERPASSSGRELNTRTAGAQQRRLVIANVTSHNSETQLSKQALINNTVLTQLEEGVWIYRRVLLCTVITFSKTRMLSTNKERRKLPTNANVGLATVHAGLFGIKHFENTLKHSIIDNTRISVGV